MNIKDYLHLYLGCDVKVKEWKYKSKFVELYEDGILVKDAFTTKISFGGFDLILRPLSDMTKDEFKEIFKPVQPDDVTDEQLLDAIEHLREAQFDSLDFGGMDAMAVFEIFRKLLSKHFDLFGLIKAGLAIDATTLHNREQGVQVSDTTEAP